MTRKISTRLTLMTPLIATLMATGPAGAQTPQTPQPPQPPAAVPAVVAPVTPPALTYDMAKQVIEAAEAEARRNKWNVVIVVTDAAGVPVMLHRLDGAGARPYDIAMRKAATVVASKLATSAYGEQLKAGGVKEVPNGITFAGGVPIMRGGELIGAVGTSGVRAIQDEQISQAGAAVIK